MTSSAKTSTRRLFWLFPMVLLALLASLTIQLRKFDVDSKVPSSLEGFRIPTRLVQTMSIGHVPIAVDAVLLRLLMDSAHKEKPLPGKRALSYFDLDLATDLDPAFLELYIAGANLLSVIQWDGASARDILLKGKRFIEHDLGQYPERFQNEYWSDRFWIPLVLAYVYLFDLDDMPHAADAFQMAAAMPNSPPYLQSLAARFAKPGGQFEVGIRLINFMLLQNRGSAEDAKLLKKRQSLFLAQHLFLIEQSLRQYLSQKTQWKGVTEIPRDRLSTIWKSFLKETRTSDRDPWGGLITLGRSGKVLSATPHEKVFGLE